MTEQTPDLISAELRTEMERERRERAKQIIQDRIDAGELVRLPGGNVIETSIATPEVIAVALQLLHAEHKQVFDALDAALGVHVTSVRGEEGMLRCGTTRYRVIEVPKGVPSAEFERYLEYMLSGLEVHGRR